MNKNSKIYEYGISSRLHKIFIELHGYFFFHGPSDLNRIDRRFVGRKLIIKKLKSILMNSDSKSGAYLITGNRGMGKTSFVSKVLNEIDSSNNIKPFGPRYLRIVVFLTFITILKTTGSWQNSLFLIVLPLISFLWSLFYLDKSDKNKRNFHKNQEVHYDLIAGISRRRRFFRSFIFFRDEDSNNAFRRIVKELFICSSIHLVAQFFLIFLLKNNVGYKDRFLIYLFLVIILSLLNFGYNVNRRLTVLNLNPKRKGKHNFSFLDAYQYLKDKITKYLNFSRRIYIRINLGYEDIQEIEIFKFLSSNIEKEFRKFRRSFSKQFLNKLFRIVLIYFCVSTLYYQTPFYNLNNELKWKLDFFHYFPSQDEEILFDFNDNTSKLKDLVSNSNPVQIITVFVDISVYYFFQKIKKIIRVHPIPVKESLAVGNIDSIRHRFHFIPVNIDYFFIFYLLLFYFFGRYLFPKLVNATSDDEILRELKNLNEIIEFQISSERGNSFNIKGGSGSFGVSLKKKKSRSTANLREIEEKLLNIFNMFENKSRLSIKPDFICIFDELDKIEPYSNYNIEEKEEQQMKFSSMDSSFYSSEGARQRQHRIFSILSNLKNFLTTAKSKFIFIAGREMYDAALADVSDRNFLIGSIFHEVINVHSFLSDYPESNNSDISSMTELYVCQFLFPSYYRIEKYSLNEYQKYLEKYFHQTENKSKYDKEITKIKINKIINTLRAFITFLTYRSNGSPKKITSYFENYIFTKQKNDKYSNDFIKHKFATIVGFNSDNMYLKFGYYDQYIFGIISYLFSPITFSVSKSMKDYGDKLLISTSFLINHLYKFHKNAFLWRNIELTPEILDINKAPQIREVIERIINILSKNHLKEIESGLFTMKFRKKISEEIAFLSKISDREAAAFNFTLDESLSLKQHHKRLLTSLSAEVSRENKAEFSNSKSFLHMILGDLYFYDEELNESIIEYMQAVKYLRDLEFTSENLSFFVLLIRNMLKLSYTLEKKKSYISSLLIYGVLVSKIINFREIDLKKLGLKVMKVNKKKFKKYISGSNNLLIEANKKRILHKNKKDIFVVVKDTFPFSDNKKLNLLNTMLSKSEIDRVYCESIEYANCNNLDNIICIEDDLKQLLDRKPYTPMKADLIFNNISFESVSLMLQPLISRFQMIEKVQLGGITLLDYKRLKSEYYYITKVISFQNKPLIGAEFWSKVADILYFKNGILDNDKKIYCNTQDCFCQKSELISKSISRRINLPCKACKLYFLSLKRLAMDLINISYKELNYKESLMMHLAYFIEKKKMKLTNSVSLKIIANIMSGIGNCFFSCSSKDSIISSEFISEFIHLFKEEESNFAKFFSKSEIANKNYSKRVINIILKKNIKFSKIEEVLIYYYLAYGFYKIAGEEREAFEQILKIVYLFRNVLIGNKKNRTLIKKHLSEISESIIKKGIRNVYRSYGNVHRLEIEIFKEILEHKDLHEKEVDLKNLSINANLRELIISFLEIKVLCNDFNVLKDPDLYFQSCRVNPFSNNTRMYDRIIELKYKVLINYQILKKLKLLPIFKNLSPKENTNNTCKITKKILSMTFTKEQIELIKTLLCIERKGEGARAESEDIEFDKDLVHKVIEFMIIDSIFCLNEIIKLIDLYGISYNVSYSLKAYAHKRMGDWSQLYFKYIYNVDNLQDSKRKRRIKSGLSDLIDPANMNYIGSRYHYEKARECYYSIFELHSQGKSYKEMLENMFYLNDDFNDTTYHFNAACDRYRINSGIIKSSLKDVKMEIKDSDIYKEKKYFFLTQQES